MAVLILSVNAHPKQKDANYQLSMVIPQSSLVNSQVFEIDLESALAKMQNMKWGATQLWH